MIWVVGLALERSDKGAQAVSLFDLNKRLLRFLRAPACVLMGKDVEDFRAHPRTSS